METTGSYEETTAAFKESTPSIDETSKMPQISTTVAPQVFTVTHDDHSHEVHSLDPLVGTVDPQMVATDDLPINPPGGKTTTIRQEKLTTPEMLSVPSDQLLFDHVRNSLPIVDVKAPQPLMEKAPQPLVQNETTTPKMATTTPKKVVTTAAPQNLLKDFKIDLKIDFKDHFFLERYAAAIEDWKKVY